MLDFRDHLLTLLFFVAAAFVGAVDFTRENGEATLAMLLTGVVYVAGAWGAVGQAHRLLRGAVVVAAPFAATLPFYLISSSPDEAGMILAATSVVSLASFGASGITSLVVSPFNAPPPPPEDRHWQISLSEILGWTVVVAIASVAVSKSALPGDVEWAFVTLLVTNSVPFAAMIALFLAPRPHRDRAALVVSASLFGAWYVLVAAVFGGPNFPVWDESGATAQILCFVALWILCVRLDDYAVGARSSDSREPAIKIHDESSQDER